MTILVVGEGREVALLLDELIKEESVSWATSLEDAIKLLEGGGEYAHIVICVDDGLAIIDEAAANMKMAAENMPVIIAVQEGMTDGGASAGIALGNIDKIIPECTRDAVMRAYREC